MWDGMDENGTENSRAEVVSNALANWFSFCPEEFRLKRTIAWNPNIVAANLDTINIVPRRLGLFWRFVMPREAS
jgi:hypothetical protein